MMNDDGDTASPYDDFLKKSLFSGRKGRKEEEKGFSGDGGAHPEENEGGFGGRGKEDDPAETYADGNPYQFGTRAYEDAHREQKPPETEPPETEPPAKKPPEEDDGKPVDRLEELKRMNEERAGYGADDEGAYSDRTPVTSLDEDRREQARVADERFRRDKRLEYLREHPDDYDSDALGDDRRLGIIRNEDGTFGIEDGSADENRREEIEDAPWVDEDEYPDGKTPAGKQDEAGQSDRVEDAGKPADAVYEDPKKQDVFKRHAEKFLRAAGEVAVENWGEGVSRGWDMAQNLVRMTLTHPSAMSSSSRAIGLAVSGMQTASDFQDRALERYDIRADADPELMKDTLRYKLYLRDKKQGDNVAGNTFRAIAESLARNGGDMSDMSPSQLASHMQDMNGEKDRILAALGEKNLKPSDRRLLTAQAQHLQSYMSGIAKQAKSLQAQEAESQRYLKESDLRRRMQAYGTLGDGNANPFADLLKEASPDYRLEIDLRTGMPVSASGLNLLARTIESRQAIVASSDMDPATKQAEMERLAKLGFEVNSRKSVMAREGNRSRVMGYGSMWQDLVEELPYFANDMGRNIARIYQDGVLPSTAVSLINALRPALTKIINDESRPDEERRAATQVLVTSVKSRAFMMLNKMIYGAHPYQIDKARRFHEDKAIKLSGLIAEAEKRLGDSSKPLTDEDRAQLESELADLREQRSLETSMANELGDPNCQADDVGKLSREYKALHRQIMASNVTENGYVYGTRFNEKDPNLLNAMRAFDDSFMLTLYKYTGKTIDANSVGRGEADAVFDDEQDDGYDEQDDADDEHYEEQDEEQDDEEQDDEEQDEEQEGEDEAGGAGGDGRKPRYTYRFKDANGNAYTEPLNKKQRATAAKFEKVLDAVIGDEEITEEEGETCQDMFDKGLFKFKKGEVKYPDDMSDNLLSDLITRVRAYAGGLSEGRRKEIATDYLDGLEEVWYKRRPTKDAKKDPLEGIVQNGVLNTGWFDKRDDEDESGYKYRVVSAMRAAGPIKYKGGKLIIDDNRFNKLTRDWSLDQTDAFYDILKRFTTEAPGNNRRGFQGRGRINGDEKRHDEPPAGRQYHVLDSRGSVSLDDDGALLNVLKRAYNDSKGFEGLDIENRIKGLYNEKTNLDEMKENARTLLGGIFSNPDQNATDPLSHLSKEQRDTLNEIANALATNEFNRRKHPDRYRKDPDEALNAFFTQEPDVISKGLEGLWSRNEEGSIAFDDSKVEEFAVEKESDPEKVKKRIIEWLDGQQGEKDEPAGAVPKTEKEAQNFLWDVQKIPWDSTVGLADKCRLLNKYMDEHPKITSEQVREALRLGDKGLYKDLTSIKLYSMDTRNKLMKRLGLSDTRNDRRRGTGRGRNSGYKGRNRKDGADPVKKPEGEDPEVAGNLKSLNERITAWNEGKNDRVEGETDTTDALKEFADGVEPLVKELAEAYAGNKGDTGNIPRALGNLFTVFTDPKDGFANVLSSMYKTREQNENAGTSNTEVDEKIAAILGAYTRLRDALSVAPELQNQLPAPNDLGAPEFGKNDYDGGYEAEQGRNARDQLEQDAKKRLEKMSYEDLMKEIDAVSVTKTNERTAKFQMLLRKLDAEEPSEDSKKAVEFLRKKLFTQDEKLRRVCENYEPAVKQRFDDMFRKHDVDPVFGTTPKKEDEEKVDDEQEPVREPEPSETKRTFTAEDWNDEFLKTLMAEGAIKKVDGKWAFDDNKLNEVLASKGISKNDFVKAYNELSETNQPPAEPEQERPPEPAEEPAEETEEELAERRRRVVELLERNDQSDRGGHMQALARIIESGSVGGEPISEDLRNDLAISFEEYLDEAPGGDEDSRTGYAMQHLEGYIEDVLTHPEDYGLLEDDAGEEKSRGFKRLAKELGLNVPEQSEADPHY